MFSWFTCNFLLVCVFLVSSWLPMSSGSVLRSRPGCLVICDDNMRLFSFCRGVKSQTKFRALYSHHERCKLRPPCCQWLSVLNHVLFFIREKAHDKRYLVLFSAQRYYTSCKTLKCNHKTSHKIKYAVDVV